MFDFDKATGEMFLYDDIGPAWMGMIDASTVISALRDYSGKVILRINSAGGSVDDAIAIYNALERHNGGVDVAVDSIAASSASFIAMVGESITMSTSAVMMIHSPWTIAMGNSTELRKTAELLDKYQDRIAGAYKKRLKIDDEGMNALLAAETWYDAKEAITAGLADMEGNYSTTPAVVASGRFNKTPERLVASVAGGTRTKVAFAREQASIRLKQLTSCSRTL